MITLALRKSPFLLFHSLLVVLIHVLQLIICALEHLKQHNTGFRVPQWMNKWCGAKLCLRPLVFWIYMLPLVYIFSKHGISFLCNADKKHFSQIRRYKCTDYIHTAASSGASREQLGVQWLARGHLSCGYCRWKRAVYIHSPHLQFLPVLRLEPATSLTL